MPREQLLAPVLFAVPVDRWMSFDFAVAFDASLAGESNFFARIADHLQAQKRVQPFPETFQNALLRDVLLPLGNDHIAAAAGTHSHAVHNGVRSRIKLDAVLACHGAKIFTFRSVDCELLVDKLDLGHNVGLSTTGTEGRKDAYKMVILLPVDFQTLNERPDTEKPVWSAKPMKTREICRTNVEQLPSAAAYSAPFFGTANRDVGLFPIIQLITLRRIIEVPGAQEAESLFGHYRGLFR